MHFSLAAWHIEEKIVVGCEIDCLAWLSVYLFQQADSAVSVKVKPVRFHVIDIIRVNEAEMSGSMQHVKFLKIWIWGLFVLQQLHGCE